jgi:hypothetical protein
MDWRCPDRLVNYFRPQNGGQALDKASVLVRRWACGANQTQAHPTDATQKPHVAGKPLLIQPHAQRHSHEQHQAGQRDEKEPNSRHL